MAENQFNPALPLPIKWSIGDDRFNEGQQVLSLTIPVDSVTHFIDHLQNLVDQKAKDGEVYDFNKKEKVSKTISKLCLENVNDITQFQLSFRLSTSC